MLLVVVLSLVVRRYQVALRVLERVLEAVRLGEQELHLLVTPVVSGHVLNHKHQALSCEVFKMWNFFKNLLTDRRYRYIS